MRTVACILLVAAILLSCRQQGRENGRIIPKAKMEAILWDIVRADVYTNQYLKKDSLVKDTVENIRLQNKIFQNYKVTREDFRNSYEYYMARPAEMTVMLDSIIARQSKTNQTIKIKELKEYE